MTEGILFFDYHSYRRHADCLQNAYGLAYFTL